MDGVGYRPNLAEQLAIFRRTALPFSERAHYVSGLTQPHKPPNTKCSAFLTSLLGRAMSGAPICGKIAAGYILWRQQNE
jgi:hypothetical protein